MTVDAQMKEGGIYPRGFSSDSPWPWPLKKSSELVTLNYGRALRADDRVEGSIPVYGTNGQCGWHSTPLVSGPGVILGRKGQGPLGVKWCDGDFWVIDTAYYVAVDDPELDLRYFYYLVDYIGLNHLKDGTSNPSLSRDTFADLLLPFPPRVTQIEIARILKNLDDKIELNRRMNGLLEGMARAIFKAWFIDFEPVKAKVAGASSFPGMPQHVFDQLPNSFTNSELGKIPEGWEILSVSDLCLVGRGGSPRPINDFMDGTIPWIKIADATASHGPFIFETKEKLKETGVSKSVRVKPGDLILSNSATCGIPMFIELHGCIHDGWLHFANLQRVSKIFLFHALEHLTEHLVQIADGSVQKNLNTKLVGEQQLVVPPPGIHDSFGAIASRWFSLMRTAAMESRGLAAIRDTLLPKLISGELPVPTTKGAGDGG